MGGNYKTFLINLFDSKLETCYFGHGNNMEAIVKTSKKIHVKVVIIIPKI